MEHVPHGLDGTLYPVCVDVQVRDRAHLPRAHHAHAHPVALDRRTDRVGIVDFEDHDVGLDLARVDRHAVERGEPARQHAAFAWSSASRSTLWSSAYSAPAATIPAWRSAPPSICL